MPIISNVIGGLGNQMFQYAAGRALAEKYGVPLLLDTNLLKGYGLHNGFELDRVFSIDAHIATDSEIYKLIAWRGTRIGCRLLRVKSLAFLRRKKYYMENGTSFNPEFVSLPEDCYLSGYWQTERYFKVHEALIREQFRFKLPLTGKNKEFVERIKQSSGAVSLHIRRGDYVSNPQTHAAHGICPIPYYKKAMRYIELQVKNPVYFIFSDDIKWVQDNLPIQQKHYFICHNKGLESYNDMRLMSLCKHHVIANSSFSWWGAWLNSNTDKIVIAPDQWFLNPDWDSRDHVPPDWFRF